MTRASFHPTSHRGCNAWPRFRNLLVHVYWDVDYRRVHEAIRENLGDLRAFATAMVALL